ncbi:glycoside hydrolase family 1 protein [Patescibacteria group bacterium]|nr:glycoside hydrolase family 1 protein [Patescibacteria group bacterium]
MQERSFPPGFLWGTATSAHQIEGDNLYSDWWKAEQEGKVPFKSGKACDSYNRYEEDLSLAKAMHNNAHRFSVEWARIEPREGEFQEEEIEHYRKVIRSVRQRGMEPFITLHHFTNPQWFAEKGGWTNKKAPEYFERYVKFVVERLGGEAKFWATINEPLIVNMMGYMVGKFPPNKYSVWQFIAACRNMKEAHKEAYLAVKQIHPELLVGIVKNNVFFEAYLNKPLSRVTASIARYVWNRWFLNGVRDCADFIGLNHYSRNLIHVRFSNPRAWFNQNENKEISDFGWEIYPESIYRVTKELMGYGKPIYIMENGIADADDDKRPNFIRNYLQWLHRAIEEGADVRGYFHWSLLDNFEWAEGFTKRFGLIHVDFNTFERTPRKSAAVYGEICRTNSVNA